jgi:cytochrome b involved in lipid metabolism
MLTTWEGRAQSFLGKDATDAFEDVGHSDEAREILAGFFKGNLDRRVKSYLSWKQTSYKTGGRSHAECQRCHHQSSQRHRSTTKFWCDVGT